MKEFVPEHLKHQYDLYSRQAKSGISNQCNFPESVVSIDTQGECFLCRCDAWLPISVGNIMDFKNFDDIWESDRAKQLQADVRQKKFTYCSVDYCGIREEHQLQDPKWISINIDESCNLRCPSCRSSLINFTKGSEFDRKIRMANHISEMLSNYDKHCLINMSGNGDPFASLVYRPLILNTEPNTKHEYRMMTNGLLLKKLLHKTKILPSIKEYNISVDAGNRSTYERVRLGGTWDVLVDNLRWLKQNVNKKITLNFVLQNDNWTSLRDFQQLLEELDIWGWITRLEDWGTWQGPKFKINNVLDASHPNHQQCMKVLESLNYQKLNYQPSLKKLIDKHSISN
jgi:MoaA/NifB/PqqE/SkfB family radical SAM enzyme